MLSSGFRLLPQCLDAREQIALTREVFCLLEDAPLYRPVTPGGQSMSVVMSNFGDLGWCTDARGYRYQARHPVTGRAWPKIPGRLLNLWTEWVDAQTPPDACLVNLYHPGAQMGLHQDRDEADFTVPVLSISLGDTAIFRVGGHSRRDPTRSVRLASGDVCILGGEARLAFHGIDRILPGSSQVVPGGGRLNLTLRRAAPRDPKPNVTLLP